MAKFQVKISGGSGKKKAGQGGMRAFPVGTPAVGKMRAFGKSSGNGGKASVLSRITGGGVGKVKAASAGQWKHDKFPGAKTNDLRARINGGPTVTRHGGGRVVRVVRGAASGGDLRNSLGGGGYAGIHARPNRAVAGGKGAKAVGDILRGLGLGKYVGVFAREEIDAVALRSITDKDLEKLGIPLGPRKKILAARRG